jgi:hypothetical protein
MGIKRWRLIAKYRTEWAGIVKGGKGPETAVKPERRRSCIYT